jgi:hypothetical protein
LSSQEQRLELGISLLRYAQEIFDTKLKSILPMVASDHL